MDRYYTFANVNIRITGQTEQIAQGDKLLSAFQTEEKDACHTVYLESVDQLDPPEGPCVFSDAGKMVFYANKTQVRYDGVRSNGLDDAYLRIRRYADESYVQIRRQDMAGKISMKDVLTSMELEHQIVLHGGFLFHSSYIRHGDGAILFTAPSGTGKSTQADLWCRLRGAELINGDRSIVVMEDGKATAHGVPYSGSSGVSRNVSLPLKAIVRLTQAPITKIIPLTGLYAFRHIWEGCAINTWNRNDMSACMETVMETVAKVPVFHLACTPDESAVIALEEALKKVR